MKEFAFCDYCGRVLRVLANWNGRRTWVCDHCGTKRTEAT